MCPGRVDRLVAGNARPRSTLRRQSRPSGGSGGCGREPEERRLIRQGVVERPIRFVNPDHGAGRALDREPSPRCGRSARACGGARSRDSFVAASARRILSGSSPGSMTTASRRLPGPRRSNSCTGAVRRGSSGRAVRSRVGPAGKHQGIDRDDGLDVVLLLALRRGPNAVSGEARFSWICPLRCCPARRRSDAKSLRRLFGVKISHRMYPKSAESLLEVEGGDLLARLDRCLADGHRAEAVRGESLEKLLAHRRGRGADELVPPARHPAAEDQVVQRVGEVLLHAERS